ncbi:MAG: hypothetical protein V5A72_00870 [Candidatus Nanohaloarchaea archaeon]
MSFVDQTKIFYGSSAFLGILAIFYFGFEYLVALSPFTISTILLGLFLAFLGFGLRREDNTAVLSYIFSAGAYIIGLFYTTGKFNFNSDQILLSLVTSSAVFAGLGYMITQKGFELEKKQFKYGLIALTVLIGGLVAYDIASDPISYDYSLANEVEINESMDIGDVTTRKTGVLPEEAEGVNFQACIYNSTGHPRGVSGFTSSSNTIRFGSLEKMEDIRIEIDEEDLGFEGVVPVEEGEADFRCRKIEEGPKVVVAQTGDEIPRIRYER